MKTVKGQISMFYLKSLCLLMCTVSVSYSPWLLTVFGFQHVVTVFCGKYLRSVTEIPTEKKPLTIAIYLRFHFYYFFSVVMAFHTNMSISIL